MTQPHSISRMININIDEMRELVGVGIRRTSAFVRFGLDKLEEWDGADFNLSASLYYQFWPHEIAEDDRNAAREEYRSWLVGSCLRELDLFYGLFLDRVWFAIEAGELHKKSVLSDYMFDSKFSRITNVANKQRQVAEKLGTADQYEELNSLSLARNALAHHAGLVRSPVDCNNASRDVLEVKWLGFDMLAMRGGEERVVAQAPLDTKELPGEGEIRIAVRFTPRQLIIPAGAKIAFTRSQLAELCMFYKILGDKTIDGLMAFYRTKGLPAPTAVPEAPAG